MIKTHNLNWAVEKKTYPKHGGHELTPLTSLRSKRPACLTHKHSKTPMFAHLETNTKLVGDTPGISNGHGWRGYFIL